MKLKFYLRGIGIGIIVTAIILHFSLASSAGKEMSDDEIKQKAAELGMIENTVLKTDKGSGVSDNKTGADADIEADKAGTEDLQHGESEDASISMDSVSTDSVIKEEDTVSDNSANADTVSDNVASEQKADGASDKPLESDGDSGSGSAIVSGAEPSSDISIMIYAGDGSYVVAKRVYEAGLVDSAAEYDMFLCQNGFDKKLTVGNHKIPVGATPEDIAKILTSVAK